jgi:hypothetical protein
LRAAAAHRSEAAIGWLLAIAAQARVPVAVEVIEALAPYRHNAKLMQRLKSTLTARGVAALIERLDAVDG